MLPRLLPSLAGAALYALCAALWLNNHAAYETLLRWYDFMANAAPYSDLNAILQAGACWRVGVDVYSPSACMDGGAYNYAPLLLRGALLGLGPAQRMAGGLLTGALFLAACTALPPPRTQGALMLRVLAVCSSTVMYALESANFDVVLFTMTLAGVALLGASLPGRLLGYALFALGGALKFYPAALLALAMRERRPVFLLLAGAGGLAAALYLWRYGAGTLTALSMLPAGLPFRGVFGAMNVPFGAALLMFLPVRTLEPNVPQFFAAVSSHYVTVYIALAARALVLAGIASGVQLMPRYDHIRRTLPGAERMFLVAGAGLLAFCFYAAQNLEYRAVYLLFTLPGLALMGREGRVLALAVLALLWEGLFRHAAAATGWYGLQVLVWAGREYLWWFVIVRYTALALGEVRDAGRALVGGKLVV